MAILEVKNLSSFKLKLDYGVDSKGKSITKNKSFSDVKSDATGEAIYAVAKSLSGLQQHQLMDVIKVDNTSLSA